MSNIAYEGDVHHLLRGGHTVYWDKACKGWRHSPRCSRCKGRRCRYCGIEPAN
jgi:hypothetical protein